MPVKQIIVIRKDLGVRRGKEIAQGAHAACSFLAGRERAFLASGEHIPLSEAEKEWVLGKFTKICVQVADEAELLKVHEAALAAGLRSSLITDAGLTEFNGVPTNTCVGIGPDYAERLAPVTGHLRLY